MLIILCLYHQSVEQLHDVDTGPEECGQFGSTLWECSGQAAGKPLRNQKGTDTDTATTDTVVLVLVLLLLLLVLVFYCMTGLSGTGLPSVTNSLILLWLYLPVFYQFVTRWDCSTWLYLLVFIVVLHPALADLHWEHRWHIGLRSWSTFCQGDIRQT